MTRENQLFVQTNNPAGNQILAYGRAEDGTLTLVETVNAGSNTLSVFWLEEGRLRLRQVLASGGTFPVSVAIHGDLLYTLNAHGLVPSPDTGSPMASSTPSTTPPARCTSRLSPGQCSSSTLRSRSASSLTGSI